MINTVSMDMAHHLPPLLCTLADACYAAPAKGFIARQVCRRLRTCLLDLDHSARALSPVASPMRRQQAMRGRNQLLGSDAARPPRSPRSTDRIAQRSTRRRSGPTLQ